MAGQSGFFDLEERLAGLSRKGDDLERLNAVIDFELFRPELERSVPRADRSKGGRPPFDHVLMLMCGRPPRCKRFSNVTPSDGCTHVSGLSSRCMTAGPDAVRGLGLYQSGAINVA